MKKSWIMAGALVAALAVTSVSALAFNLETLGGRPASGGTSSTWVCPNGNEACAAQGFCYEDCAENGCGNGCGGYGQRGCWNASGNAGQRTGYRGMMGGRHCR